MLDAFCIDTASNLLHELNKAIGNNRPFCCYKYPNESFFSVMIQQEGEVKTFFDATAIDNCDLFLIAPFRVTPITPIVGIRPDVCLRFTIPCDEVPFPSATQLPDPKMGRSSYRTNFHEFMHPLLQGDFQKIVLSRSLSLQAIDKPQPLGLFLRAIQRYPRQFVALFHTEPTGMWLVATPELLVSHSDGPWKTVALAGTISVDAYKPELGVDNWDHKNQEEQALVARYIQERLTPLTTSINLNSPTPIRAADVMHLCSDISFSLLLDVSVGRLLATLHPTPAVCGCPLTETYDFILNHEHVKREYYAGYAGFCSLENTRLFVSLRCMKIDNDTYHLFAGGGLLPKSREESEWKETNYKMRTMLNLFSNIR